MEDLLQQNEYALLEGPCNEIPKWAELSQHEVPQTVLDRLENTNALSASFIQKLEDASGAVVNMDKFSVTVPGNDIPNGWSAEQYLDHIRTNLNNYIDNSISIFEPYPGLNDEDKWNGPNSLGSVFSIQLTP